MSPVIKCFFVEKGVAAFEQLKPAVMAHHDPERGFHVETYRGRFEDAIKKIVEYSEGMSLTFIDPTGWTEYAFDKIDPLLRRKPGEVLVNFMYDHISRFTSWNDDTITESFNGILRPGWRDRIDRTLSPGDAAEKIFRKELKEAGNFVYVVSTPIKKATDRTHFCITYATRHSKGIEVYRGIEYNALCNHDFRRLESRINKKTTETGQGELFLATDLPASRAIDAQYVAEQVAATEWLKARLHSSSRKEKFGDLWPEMLEIFTIRKADAKAICVNLARAEIISETWKARGSRVRTPDDNDIISLRG